MSVFKKNESIWSKDSTKRKCSGCGMFKNYETEFPSNKKNRPSKCKQCLATLRAEQYHGNSEFRDKVRISQANHRTIWKGSTWNHSAVAYNMFHAAKKRAKSRNVPFGLTLEFIEYLLEYPFCFYLGIELSPGKDGKSIDTSPTIDCIVPELGYIVPNIRLCSFKANTMKSNSSLEELEMLVSKLKRTMECA